MVQFPQGFEAISRIASCVADLIPLETLIKERGLVVAEPGSLGWAGVASARSERAQIKRSLRGCPIEKAFPLIKVSLADAAQ